MMQMCRNMAFIEALFLQKNKINGLPNRIATCCLMTFYIILSFACSFYIVLFEKNWQLNRGKYFYNRVGKN